MRRLYVLRPQPAAGRTAARARAMGLDAAVLPLFEIQPLAWDPPPPEQFDALLFTSANGVRHAGSQAERYKRLPVYAVGEATAEAARQLGFELASTGDGGVDALLDAIPSGQRLLHLCGADRREPSWPKQSIAAVPVYRSQVIERPQGLDQISGGVAMVHSPRAAARLAELIEPDVRRRIAVAAISAAAAAAAGSGWQCVQHAKAPSDDALLALAARLCETPAQ